MVKSKGLGWIALKNQNILAVKVQYSHCSKFYDFSPALVGFWSKNHFKLKTQNRECVPDHESRKIVRSDNWFHSYEPRAVQSFK
jgi:hypothetical protein